MTLEIHSNVGVEEHLRTKLSSCVPLMTVRPFNQATNASARQYCRSDYRQIGLRYTDLLNEDKDD